MQYKRHSSHFSLLQECHWLNSLLCLVRQSLHRLELHLLGGQEAMPKDALAIAKALQEDAVPSQWVHPNRFPSSHSLVSWTQGRLTIVSNYLYMRWTWSREI